MKNLRISPMEFSPSSPFSFPNASAPKASSNKLPDICIVEIPVVTMMPLTPASATGGALPQGLLVYKS